MLYFNNCECYFDNWKSVDTHRVFDRSFFDLSKRNKKFSIEFFRISREKNEYNNWVQYQNNKSSQKKITKLQMS